MHKDQVPEFVDAIVKTGCPICAVGHDLYVFAEVDLPPDDMERVVKEIHVICERFGEREHLRLEIVAYLRSIGRFYDLPGETMH